MAQALLRLEPASAHPTDVQLTRNLIFSFIQLAQWPAAVKVCKSLNSCASITIICCTKVRCLGVPPPAPNLHPCT